MNNNRQIPLLFSDASESNAYRPCNNFPCCTTQELAQLKWRNIYVMVSVMVDMPRIWLTIMFIIVWSFDIPNYFQLIPFIPTLLLTSILIVGFARESNLRVWTGGILDILLRFFFYILISLFVITLSLCCPNTLFSILTSNPLMVRSRSNKNARLEALFLRRQQIYFSFISAVLQYVTGGVSFKQNVHRIVATNYFLQSAFHEALPGAKKEKNAIYLDHIRHLHEEIKPNPDANKLVNADVYWSELADVVTSDKERMLLIHVGLLLYIWSFIQTVLMYWCGDVGTLGMGTTVVFWVYVGGQLASCRLHWLFYTFALYLKRVLPIFNWDTRQLKALKWKETFEAPEDMMTCIRAVHEILYEVQHNEIRCIYDCVLQYDIAGLIAQYVWIELPGYADIVEGIGSYVEYKRHLELPKGVEVLIEDD